MKVAFKSDVGQVRSHNEDNGGFTHNKEGVLLAVVADGMGGHQAGDVASQMTIEILSKKWQETDGITTPTTIESWLAEAITDVNAQLFIHSLNNPQCQGMGTTLVAVVCTNQFVTYAHIGDSRAYLINKETILQKTEDHTLVNELVRSGQITPLEAENHPRRNVILRALGTERTIKVDIKTIEWDEEDFILLCSDGLSNKVTDAEMSEVLQKNLSLEEKAAELITVANERGGEDNISVALVHNSHKENRGDGDDW
ncbi:Stp1/IreP family PP2C-type Ser/Thr phosphatase [Anaerobacillus isosaccharinicus]|uniref:protein-serine/threonine phosphatase n=1 Tax=Anaerobacillus isosaccharinicus TaxID=1532552 RepID=A0A1S2L6R6_9BACI|nr:Stp1/IreP family PP2C-type Ser/Thr phosphatase [Anaerobacillus isosaccharinicus]MBA5587390.1 Stp1/IreP family PP2C-type Ser/Thr phosphatase [Anaerobacillus isosaccharinicus]QOY34419.1 Stp1/IreP family PP2C-type Ser/Thr phosphatase [Anaerobacillus isosaccharinicus]